MTPAVVALQRAKVPFVVREYDHDPAHTLKGKLE